MWKEPCPELLLHHLVALTPRLFYPSPPTMCSPPATRSTVGGSSGIVAGSLKTGDMVLAGGIGYVNLLHRTVLKQEADDARV